MYCLSNSHSGRSRNKTVACATSSLNAAPWQPLASSTPVKRPRCEVCEDDSSFYLEVTESTIDGEMYSCFIALQISTKCMPLSSLNLRLMAHLLHQVCLIYCTQLFHLFFLMIHSTSVETKSHKMKKFIVYEDDGMQLFQCCPLCTRSCIVSTRTAGSLLHVDQRCPNCEYSFQWDIQPSVNRFPAGNLQLAAAVMFTGSSSLKVSQVSNGYEYKRVFQRHNLLKKLNSAQLIRLKNVGLVNAEVS